LFVLPALRRTPVRSAPAPFATAAPQQPPPAAATAATAATPSESPSAGSTKPSKPPVLSSEIREAFLAHYAALGHTRMPSASLIPEDPTLLLNVAGMVPFKPVFLGFVDPPCDPPCVTSAQKCIRTNDIDNVGRTTRHHTFFEMLGNFSFGAYFKEEAIHMAWRFLTEVMQIDPARLAVSVFREDDDAYDIWVNTVGVPASRVIRLDEEDNFWAAGPTGPCGPCSEIYYDYAPQSPLSADSAIDLNDDTRFVEIYNLVFMQYNRSAAGDLTPLKTKCIDTGLGLERLCAVVQHAPSNFDTDLFRPLLAEVEALTAVAYPSATPAQQVSFKVIADHARATAHLAADGVRPSNIGRGYVLRRLVRRMVRHARMLGVTEPIMGRLPEVAMVMAAAAGYGEMEEQRAVVLRELAAEEGRFRATLDRGEVKLAEVIERAAAGKVISGDDAFELYDTYGFPLELTEEAAAESGLAIDRAGFEACMASQRERARAARSSVDVTANAALAELGRAAGPTQFLGYAQLKVPGAVVVGVVDRESGEALEVAEEGQDVAVLLARTPFYAEGGGQVGDRGALKGIDAGLHLEVTDVRSVDGAWAHMGEISSGTVRVGQKVSAEVDAWSRGRIRAHHTATHLLQAALKKVLVDLEISQAGSLVNAERLRFDFSASRAPTAAELVQVEELINSWIGEDHPTEVASMSLEDAQAAGAVAMFGEKYDKSAVRVVNVPGVSMELCGGTHVGRTSEIGAFKIVSETGIAAGVRRIEALCGLAIMPYLTIRDNTVRELCGMLKTRPEELCSRVGSLQDELRSSTKESAALRSEIASAKSLALLASAESISSTSVIISTLDGVDADGLKSAAESLLARLGDDGAVLLASAADGKVALVAAFGAAAQKRGLNAGKVVGAAAKMCGGGGGGKPGFAQAGGRDASKLEEALAAAKELVVSTLAKE